MSDLPLAFLGLFKAVQFLVVPSQFTFEQITSGRHSHSRQDTVAAVYQVIELMRTAAKPSMHPHEREQNATNCHIGQFGALVAGLATAELCSSVWLRLRVDCISHYHERHWELKRIREAEEPWLGD